MSNIVKLIIIGILMLGIPLGVKLAQDQQIFKSKAAVGDPCSTPGQTWDGDCIDGEYPVYICNENYVTEIQGWGSCAVTPPPGADCNNDNCGDRACTAQEYCDVNEGGSSCQCKPLVVTNPPPPSGGGCSPGTRKWDCETYSNDTSCAADACVGVPQLCNSQGQWEDADAPQCTWECFGSCSSQATPTPTEPPSGGTCPASGDDCVYSDASGKCYSGWLENGNPATAGCAAGYTSTCFNPQNTRCNYSCGAPGGISCPVYSGGGTGTPTISITRTPTLTRVPTGTRAPTATRVPTGTRTSTPTGSTGGGSPTTTGNPGPSGSVTVTPATAPNYLSCNVSGPDSIGRDRTATYTVTTTDSRVRTIELAYNYGDLSNDADWHKLKTCYTDILGDCAATIQGNDIPGGKDQVVVACYAYSYRPGDGGEISTTTACSGNPLQVQDPSRYPEWGSCGSDSNTKVSVTTSTRYYRVSDTKFAKDNGVIAWLPYTSDDGEDPVKITYEFKNAFVGSTLTLFVQFKSSTGEASDVLQKSIKYAGADPKINSVSCEFNPAGAGTLLTINGINFGEQGNAAIKVGSVSGDITSWVPLPVESGEATSSATSSGNIASNIQPFKVMAKIKEKFEGKMPVALTLNSGQAVNGTCTIGLTTVDFAAHIQCLPPGAVASASAKLQIVEQASKAKPVFDNSVLLDAEGFPKWTAPKLEINKIYDLIIKGPKGIAIKKDFTALEGTSVLEDFFLPVGDIFPLVAPDGTINTLDKGELTREWSTASDVTRAGDFNSDNRVNTLDYACMRTNFNKNGEKFLRTQ